MKRVDEKRQKIGKFALLSSSGVLFPHMFRIFCTNFEYRESIFSVSLTKQTHTHTVDEVANVTAAHANQVYQHFMYAQRSNNKKPNVENRTYSKNRTEEGRCWVYDFIDIPHVSVCSAAIQNKYYNEFRCCCYLHNSIFLFFSQTFFGASLCAIRMCAMLACIVELIEFATDLFVGCNWSSKGKNLLIQFLGWPQTFGPRYRFSTFLSNEWKPLSFAAGQIWRGSGRVRNIFSYETMTHRRQSS